MGKHKPLPPIGARIIKSSLGSLICVGIYFIRELLPIGSGIPFYSILAVLWCIQPYTTSTLAMAKQRTVAPFLARPMVWCFCWCSGHWEAGIRQWCM